jgi:hypothetical protein
VLPILARPEPALFDFLERALAGRSR